MRLNLPLQLYTLSDVLTAPDYQKNWYIRSWYIEEYYNFHSVALHCVTCFQSPFPSGPPLSSIICQKAFVKAFFTSSTLPLLAAPSESPRDRSAPKLSCSDLSCNQDPMAHHLGILLVFPTSRVFESHRLPCWLPNGPALLRQC